MSEFGLPDGWAPGDDGCDKCGGGGVVCPECGGWVDAESGDSWECMDCGIHTTDVHECTACVDAPECDCAAHGDPTE